MEISDIQYFKKKFGIPLNLVTEAFTHPSMRLDNVNIRSYERLEILGDSVLDLIVLKQLMVDYPRAEPGELTHKRSILVNNEVLGKIGKALRIEKLLRRPENYVIVTKDLAKTVEALFGAIYLHAGLSSCEDFLKLIWDKFLEILQTTVTSNPIGYLQELLQKRNLQVPQYETIHQEGTAHDPFFTIQCTVFLPIDQIFRIIGKGRSMQKGKIAAATKMIEIVEKYFNASNLKDSPL